MISRNYFFVLVLFVLTACKSHQASVAISNTYDPVTNITTLIQVPYGNIAIPGKWIEVNFNTSRQQTFLKNADSVSIAVGKNPQKNYKVHSSNQNDKQFVSAFYKWDSKQQKHKGEIIELLNDNSDNGYIIWRLKGQNINTIFLCGAKKSLFYNFVCFSPTWTDQQRIQFLVNLFYTN
ncbi:MAG: hypothetical protein PSX36_15075 [bacterium]|nr:hypothetical protein [bacterium]